MTTWVLVMVIMCRGITVTTLQVDHTTQTNCEATRTAISKDIAEGPNSMIVLSQGCYMRR